MKRISLDNCQNRINWILMNTSRERKNQGLKKKMTRKGLKRTKKYVATFDPQAVLQTPCSNVSQTYYKRKLISSNLTAFSLGDNKGTCYVWNETRGQGGSSEIGTCIMTHLSSLPASVKHVLYFDFCSKQNRYQYLAAGLLNTVCWHLTMQSIKTKFVESSHTQMGCD